MKEPRKFQIGEVVPVERKLDIRARVHWAGKTLIQTQPEGRALMDQVERESLGRQLAGAIARAKREKATLYGFHWREGRLIPMLEHAPGPRVKGEDSPPVAEPPPIPKKGMRGLVQTELPL